MLTPVMLTTVVDNNKETRIRHLVPNLSQPPTVVCKNGSSVGIRTHCVYDFARPTSICMLSWGLVTKFLHWSSVESLLRVRCWFGWDSVLTCGSQCKKKVQKKLCYPRLSHTKKYNFLMQCSFDTDFEINLWDWNYTIQKCQKKLQKFLRRKKYIIPVRIVAYWNNPFPCFPLFSWGGATKKGRRFFWLLPPTCEEEGMTWEIARFHRQREPDKGALRGANWCLKYLKEFLLT